MGGKGRRTNKHRMKAILSLLGLVAIDFLIIWFLVYRIPPEPSAALGLLVAVPATFLVNIWISVVLFLAQTQRVCETFFAEFDSRVSDNVFYVSSRT